MAYDNRGLAWHKKGEYDRAIEDYDRAIELFEKAGDRKNVAAAFYNRASAAALKGDKPIMLESLRKAVELDPVYKKKAEEDEDFKKFRDDEEFKRLVGG